MVHPYDIPITLLPFLYHRSVLCAIVLSQRREFYGLKSLGPGLRPVTYHLIVAGAPARFRANLSFFACIEHGSGKRCPPIAIVRCKGHDCGAAATEELQAVTGSAI
jgi:hypothetical protein